MSIQTITPAELNERIRAGGGRAVTLIDVRTPAEFARVHAAGARLIPLDTIGPAAVAAIRTAGDGEPVYVICHSGARAANACERLVAAGVGPVFNVAGGTAAWVRAGLPVERGAGAISLERQVRIVAGSLVLLGSVLAWAVHPLLLALPVLVGAGLIFAGVTDFCGMAIALGKMPWNRASSSHC